MSDQKHEPTENWPWRLMTLRKRLKKDQLEMGILLGVDRAWVSRLENNRGVFSGPIKAAIEKAEEESGHKYAVSLSSPPSPPSAAESEQARYLMEHPPAVGSFKEFLLMLRGCREEAERLGGGDPELTRTLFREILRTAEKTMSLPITPEDHDDALDQVIRSDAKKKPA